MFRGCPPSGRMTRGHGFYEAFLGYLDSNGAWWFCFISTSRWIGFRLDTIAAIMLTAGAMLAMAIHNKVSLQRPRESVLQTLMHATEACSTMGNRLTLRTPDTLAQCKVGMGIWECSSLRKGRAIHGLIPVVKKLQEGRHRISHNVHLMCRCHHGWWGLRWGRCSISAGRCSGAHFSTPSQDCKMGRLSRAPLFGPDFIFTQLQQTQL